LLCEVVEDACPLLQAAFAIIQRFSSLRRTARRRVCPRDRDSRRRLMPGARVSSETAMSCADRARECSGGGAGDPAAPAVGVATCSGSAPGCHPLTRQRFPGGCAGDVRFHQRPEVRHRGRSQSLRASWSAPGSATSVPTDGFTSPCQAGWSSVHSGGFGDANRTRSTMNSPTPGSGLDVRPVCSL
jgi:hypothetical protein